MKILTVIGARPQFIKAAPVSRAILALNAARAGREGIVEVLVHTGQHYDREMSDVFFQELNLPEPAYHLGVGAGPHGRQTGRMLEGVERVLELERPDLVLVYGDTNSTLAGALAAGKLGIPIVHVEAGLRSFNRAMPEELNRVVTDHLSTHLFCPTSLAVKNLSCEGIVKGVHLVGDVMREVLMLSLPIARARSQVLARLSLQPKTYGLVTVHRAENTDVRERLAGILQALARLDRPAVFPCHPRTKKMVEQFGLAPLLESSSARVIEPLSYFDMLRLESEAAVILTDSGGMQKEACWLGVPCVTLRDETEWVETVEAGWNRLAGADPAAIVAATRAALEARPSEPGQLYGDGRAAERILAIVQAAS
jgi:UDP-N-acetylglucosamine 2-epimerase (non-hydrolysing)/UDP-GlcNAc3NAcA epimerase